MAAAPSCAADDDVAAEHEVGAAGGTRMAWMSSGAYRAALLREPGHVDDAAPLPSRCAAMPRMAPMVTTPVPPMPVTSMFHGRSMRGCSGSGRAGPHPRLAGRLDAFFSFAALHGDEARAEALEAGVVLVAHRLVDLALAAELGLERLRSPRSSTARRSRRSPRRRVR
jgi:hypothetical protein